jgi:hypothetical protein
MLYSEAGGIYVENSEVAMSESIREALWSLEEAFESYALAGDEAANTVRERYITLASRISPFSSSDNAAKKVESRKAEAVRADSKKKEFSIPDGLAAEIEDFVKARRSGQSKTDSFDAGYVMRSISMSGGSRLDEKSIAS